MSKKNTRRGARTLAFQVLYSLAFAESVQHEDVVRAFHQVPKATPPHAIPTEVPEVKSKKGAAKKVAPEVPEEEKAHVYDGMVMPTGFAWELVDGIWREEKVLDKLLAEHSRNWRVDRIGRIELTILRMAVYEMLHREDVPTRVAINEALELSRLFGEESARPFINGMLDTIGKLVDSGEIKRQ